MVYDTLKNVAKIFGFEVEKKYRMYKSELEKVVIQIVGKIVKVFG